MVDDPWQSAARQLLRDHPTLEFFYAIHLNYSDGSTGFSSFHSLASDQTSCRGVIQRLCKAQKEESEQTIAALQELPEDERPYDPAIADGCSVTLCIVLPDGGHYIPVHSQSWLNGGQSFHSPLIPDVFDVAYYRDKVLHGEYLPERVKS